MKNTFYIVLKASFVGLSIYERDYDERTVLHIAAAEGNEPVLKFLLERWNDRPGRQVTMHLHKF